MRLLFHHCHKLNAMVHVHACVNILFHVRVSKMYLLSPVGQTPWFVAENQTRVESRVAIKALVVRLSVFLTCSTLLYLSSRSFCIPVSFPVIQCYLTLLAWYRQNHRVFMSLSFPLFSFFCADSQLSSVSKKLTEIFRCFILLISSPYIIYYILFYQ